jgi:thioesterase domain-containing protein
MSYLKKTFKTNTHTMEPQYGHTAESYPAPPDMLSENTETNGVPLSADRHILRLNEGGELLPAFLIPGAGGLADSYFGLARGFAEIPVYGLHMMGTQKGERPFSTIQEMAEQNIRWMRAIQPAGPYCILGHSFGGHVAYEMGHQLEKMGQAVSLVGILDVWAGYSGIRLTDQNKVDFVLNLAADYYRDFDIIREPYPEWVGQLANNLSAIPLDKIVPYVGTFLKENVSGLDEAIDFVTRLIDLRLYNAQMNYRPEQLLSAELIVFQTRSIETDNAMGWGPFGQNVRAILLPGNHDMLQPENIGVISHELNSRLGPSRD